MRFFDATGSICPLLTRLRSDQFTQWYLTAVRRVAQIGVDRRIVVHDATGVCVGAEAPLAVVLAYPGIADAAKRQVRNQRLDRALVESKRRSIVVCRPWE